jgi:hypothetical protein
LTNFYPLKITFYFIFHQSNPNRQQHQQQQQHRVQGEQRQKPNGPQNLSFDNANATGHASAFVPLQAILKGNKNAKKQPQSAQTVQSFFQINM